MNWENNRINLGVVKEKSTNKFSFLLVEPVEVTKITPSCGGCTTAKLKDNFLNVTYKPGKIPKHIADKHNFQYVTKTITVTYADGQKEVLTFTAKIEKL